MRTLLRLCVLLVAVAALLGGWVAAHAVGLPVPGLEGLRRLRAEGRRQEELGARNALLLGRCRAKRCVALELVEGRLTLRLAVAALRRLYDADAADLDGMLLLPGGATEEEALARSALSWASAEMDDRPAEQRAAVLGRLRAEFAELTARPSALATPDPSPREGRP
jgi:hypothetical protein